jgi:4-hydroxybenzoate polyprenyltransferase
MLLLRELLIACRPKQWAKNVIVFFAFFFTIYEQWDPKQPGETLALFGVSVAAFLLFCALSSAGYLVNDLRDAPQDRRHPRKRLRPIAAGRLSGRTAAAAAILLMGLGLGLSFMLQPWFGLVAVCYLVLTSAYSLGLKRIAILDVLALSGGYVLRAVAGAVAIQAPISPWLYVVTSLGALLIGLGKRRNELALAGAAGQAAQQREALEEYSLHLLDQLIAVAAPATLVSYILYTFTAPNLPPDHTMMLTIPFVLYGLFRYLFLVYQRNLGENPEDVLLTDRPLVAAGTLWLLTAALVLALGR